MRSIAIRVVGVAISTLQLHRVLEQRRVALEGRGQEGVGRARRAPRTRAVGSNCAPVLLRREAGHVLAHVTGVRAQPFLDHVGVARLGGAR